ncbi:MAG: hypothetical protein IMY71_10200 [Bacteroidetes bacterium]|nr:hypothetical protein [Bacteroidota bacterium]
MAKTPNTKLYWLLAFIITIAAAYYQRKTGPTYAKEINITLDGKNYEIELPRSHGGDDACPIKLEIADNYVQGELSYRKYPTNDSWQTILLNREGELLTGNLPHQSPAGKLEYFLKLSTRNEEIDLFENNPVIIRFKGSVPAGVLVPHIIIMFAAMLLSNFSGIIGFMKHPKQRFYGRITLALLFLGGLILGPIVQFHAFGEYWTGIPFGWDLTDNKLLIAFIFWVIAIAGNRKREKPSLTVLAAVILLLIYSIPHSMFGSELDHETGEVITGMVQLFLF